jgi:hypothetical protein
VVVTAASRELGHCNADDEETDRGLDVGTVRHREPLVRLGEEEVEPQARGDRGN